MPSNEVAMKRQAPYLLFILLASILALVTLAAGAIVDRATEIGRIIAVVDLLLCALFFGDFLVCFWKAESKLKYMITWGWLDLISCIPEIEALRWGRASRLLRVLRVLRGVRSARILMRFILERRGESLLLAASMASIVIVALACIAILHFELDAGASANIRTAEDAIWWSVVTLTTVGYGDRYPVTSEGRVVAAFLMASGVALIGTWSGIAASWFLAAAEKRHGDDIQRLTDEVQELKRLIELQGK